mmetsp:Transcript_14445/g.41523  ORF Transcript_14445/g.41523 Transcript_14445/m.41523 type:complete len:247 (+) Transcript_14445:314-1054(+)
MRVRRYLLRGLLGLGPPPSPPNVLSLLLTPGLRDGSTRRMPTTMPTTLGMEISRCKPPRRRNPLCGCRTRLRRRQLLLPRCPHLRHIRIRRRHLEASTMLTTSIRLRHNNNSWPDHDRLGKGSWNVCRVDRLQLQLELGAGLGLERDRKAPSSPPICCRGIRHSPRPRLHRHRHRRRGRRACCPPGAAGTIRRAAAGGRARLRGRPWGCRTPCRCRCRRHRRWYPQHLERTASSSSFRRYRPRCWR